MNQVIIHWIPLKISMLPFIIKEVDQVIEKFYYHLQEVDTDAIQNLELLKVSIKARIDDFDQFYTQNYYDHRIFYFEKLKFKLQKLLYQRENITKEDISFQDTEIEELENELPLVFVNPEKGQKMIKEQKATKQKLKSNRSISKTINKKSKTPKRKTPQKQFKQTIKKKKPVKKDVLYTIKMTKSEYQNFFK